MPDPLNLPRTATQIDPAPPDPGPCPTCGQPRPNPVNRYSTGRFGPLPPATREEDGPLDYDGPLWNEVLDRLRERNSVVDVCNGLGVTPEQVRGVADHYDLEVV